MNPLLAGVAVVVVGAAVVAVSARESRLVILALGVILVAGPLLADPMATPLGIAAMLVGSLLATYLLWMASRDRASGTRKPLLTEGSRIGWPAEALVALAAGVVGAAAHGLGAPAAGSPMASATGFGLAALAVTPLLTGRDLLRTGSGIVLLLAAGLQVRMALGEAPTPLEHLVTAGLIVTVGGALATLIRAARRDGSDGMDLDLEVGRLRRRREPDAHPMPIRPGPPG